MSHRLNIDDRADEAYDRMVQEYMDDEIEARAEEEQRNAAKRAASGMSPELLFADQPKRKIA